MAIWLAYAGGSTFCADFHFVAKIIYYWVPFPPLTENTIYWMRWYITSDYSRQPILNSRHFDYFQLIYRYVTCADRALVKLAAISDGLRILSFWCFDAVKSARGLRFSGESFHCFFMPYGATSFDLFAAWMLPQRYCARRHVLQAFSLISYYIWIFYLTYLPYFIYTEIHYGYRAVLWFLISLDKVRDIFSKLIII